MRTRNVTAAALLALAMAGAGAAPALAQPPTQHPHGRSVAAHTAHMHAKAAKAAKLSFALGGTLTAVDAAAGTVSFTVQGGYDKTPRGTVVAVKVTDTTKISRDDAPATLSDLLPGDHVSVKGASVNGVRTASRVSTDAPEAPDAPESPDAPATA